MVLSLGDAGPGLFAGTLLLCNNFKAGAFFSRTDVVTSKKKSTSPSQVLT